ncbi:MAG: hypothetical protein CL534_02130 [Ahrensia sp.]|nr:hypothetical protein [Ahrensia sp.]
MPRRLRFGRRCSPNPKRPATTSHVVVQDIIRGELGFDGLLMSDDVSMNALSGDFAARTESIFGAGLDVVLHCNGVMDEMLAVAANTPILRGRALDRAEKALKRLDDHDGRLDDTAHVAGLRDELNGFFTAVV